MSHIASYYCYTITIAEQYQDDLELYMTLHFPDISYEFVSSLLTNEKQVQFGELYDHIVEITPEYQLKFYVEQGQESHIDELLRGLPMQCSLQKEALTYDADAIAEPSLVKLSDRFFVSSNERERTMIDTNMELLIIPPKNSFGTGFHASTRLAIYFLERYIHPKMSVIDVGCGTGILAMVAAKLGAQHILAVDSDPVAVCESQRVIQQNGLAECITIQKNNFVEGLAIAEYSFIIANLSYQLYEVFLDQCKSAPIVSGQGFIFSGIMVEEAERFSKLLEDHQYSVVESMMEEEWIAYYAIRTSWT